MATVTYAAGDLLDLAVSADCIVQQCNCVSKTAKGLSAAIAQRYPYAAVYARRGVNRSAPGTVVFAEPESKDDGPVVACLMAQVAIGKPGAYSSMYRVPASTDTADARLEYLRKCLETLREQAVGRRWKRIAFPHGIGCGLAGGKWADYLLEIQAFASRLDAGTVVQVVEKK